MFYRSSGERSAGENGPDRFMVKINRRFVKKRDAPIRERPFFREKGEQNEGEKKENQLTM